MCVCAFYFVGKKEYHGLCNRSQHVMPTKEKNFNPGVIWEQHIQSKSAADMCRYS